MRPEGGDVHQGPLLPAANLRVRSSGFVPTATNMKVRNVKYSLRLIKHHDDVWGSKGIAPCILNLGTTCRCVVTAFSSIGTDLSFGLLVFTQYTSIWTNPLRLLDSPTGHPGVGPLGGYMVLWGGGASFAFMPHVRCVVFIAASTIFWWVILQCWQCPH
jgi:hypothetical protein